MAGPWQSGGLNEVITHPPTPEQRAAIKAYEDAVRDHEVFEREVLLSWAAVFCTCLTSYAPVSYTQDPGYAQCLVHGRFLLTHDGRVL